MDEQQVGSLPPGYSANDVVSAGASNQPLSNQGNLPPGYSPDDIVTNQSGPSGEIHQDLNDTSLASKAVHAVGGTLEGIGEGVFGTLAGGADIVNKVTGQEAGGVTQTLHHLAGDDETQHGTAQNVGRGLETIGEFIMGDAALKGIAMSERLNLTAKILKTLEKSPRLAKALALGINVGKAGSQLSPEEAAMLKQYPVLARLAGAGVDSLSAGVTQAGQTALKTGGNVKQAAKEGAGMAAGSALIGAPLGALGGVISKGAEAAKTADVLNKTAESAPTKEAIQSQVANKVQGAINPIIDKAELAKAEAEGKLNNAQDVLGSMASEAPESSRIADIARNHVDVAHANLGNAFEKGRDFLIKAAGDNKIDYEDSGLQKAAKTQLGIGKSLEKPLDEAFEKGQPGSAIAKERLQKLVDPYGIAELKDTVKKGTKVGADGVETLNDSAKEAKKELDKIDAKGPIQLDMQELLDRRKQANEFLRSTGWATDEQRADKKIYRSMIDGIDDSIQSLLEKSGNPEAIQKLEQMNLDYKTGIARFDNPVVKSILEGKTGDVLGTLTSGKNPVANINTLRDTIGKDAFTQVADSSVQRLAADSIDKTTGQLNFKKFFNDWTKIDPEVRGAMFQESAKGGAVENAIKQIQGVNASQVIPNSDVTIKEAGKTIDDLLRKGDVTSLIKDPDRLNALSTLVGPEAMGELGHSVMQNALREAATDATGNVKAIDFDKVLKFVEQFKDQPEVVKTLFKPTPETAQAYDKLITDMQHIHGVKNLIKYGVIAPAGVAGGALAGHVVGHALMGAGIAYWGERHAGQFLDYLANHPNTWRAIKALDAAGQKPVVEGARIVAPYAAGKLGSKFLSNALKSTSSSLSNQ